MTSFKKIKLVLTIFSFLSIFVITGCDKIPFLSDYFPSSSQEETLPSEELSDQGLSEDVLARVGKWTITADEFNDRLNSLKEVVPEYDIDDFDSKRLVLEELIRQELLVQDAERSGLANEEDIVEALEEFRRTLIVRETASRITEGIDVSYEEAREYFNQNKDSFAEPAEWHLREILVPTQTEAKETLIELLKGADFSTMARARSISASSSKGGDLGFVTEFKFPQMANAVSSLDVGSISSVFKGPDGYYIVKLEEKKGGKPQPFTEVREEIKTGLTLMKQQQSILEYIDNLKSKTTITINENLLTE